MTLIFQRPVAGPATHAFVIGVGGYPNAKPGQGGVAMLQNVKDIQSAANSAKLMIDWLLDHQDSLAAPLASLEALIGDAAIPPQAPVTVYASTHPPGKPIAEPTLANVTAAGLEWVKRASVRPGDFALFYICGHGARLGTEPVVFLTDLNQNQVDPWGAYVNLGMVASAFKQHPQVRAAFFLADACQEFIPQFQLIRTGGGAMFIAPLDPFNLNNAREKVWLLSATSDGRLAYEGDWHADRNVKIGRFTETLVAAMGGASVRHKGGRWIVHPGGLFEDIKHLHRVRRPDWRDKSFEPSQGASPNEVFPIVNAATPKVPVSILTDPAEVMAQYAITVFDNVGAANPALDARVSGSGLEWLTWIPASLKEHVVIAQNPAANFREIFVPMAQIFDQRVRVT
jgi:hypothetical protein